MARQTEVVLLLILATAATIFATDFDKLVKETPANSKCPSGWVNYEGRCFTYQTAKVDWVSAEERCMTLGGHLVSIRSENEHQLVKALIRASDQSKNPTWIGLSGCQKRFKFLWSDGTKLTFTKWSSKEPNNAGGECCVHMNFEGDKHWNDIHCNRIHPFVCVKSSN